MKRHWASKKELGTAFGMRFLFELSRRLGRWPFRVSLVPVVLYFFLTQKSKREASRQYLERLYAHMGLKRSPTLFLVFRHLLTTGEGILEKILAWDVKEIAPRITHHGRDTMYRRLNQGKGILLIGSHLGNMEIARHLAQNERKVKVNVLVHTEHTPTFISLMRHINPQSQMSLYQVADLSPATAMLLKDKIDAGEVVLIAGDRIPLDGKGVASASFLSHSAQFPIGPYVLASLLECPVFLFFCLGRGTSYDIYYESFAEKIILNRVTRSEELQALANQYAERLSYYCTLAPLLWGNIYPFWEDSELGKP